MPKRWRIQPHDAAVVAALEHSVGVSSIVARLLAARGLRDAAAAKSFLAGTLADLRDPELLPGVPAAAERIVNAVRAGRKIAIYGDYDADGMCATAILIGCLEALDADAKWYVPDRFEEGYGLNAKALETLAGQGVQLVVTVDCGIASVAEALVARRLGLELIITVWRAVRGGGRLQAGVGDCHARQRRQAGDPPAARNAAAGHRLCGARHGGRCRAAGR